jgi:hypothetical protein
MSRPNIPAAPFSYNASSLQNIINKLADFAAGAFRKGEDVEFARSERVIYRSPDGTRWVHGVDNAGNTTWTLA